LGNILIVYVFCIGMAKEKNTTLIITEKPAAAKIAAALSGGADEKITNKDKVSYYEF